MRPRERTVRELRKQAAAHGNRWVGGKFGGEESPFGIDVSGLRLHLQLVPAQRLARMVAAARFAEAAAATRLVAAERAQPFDPLLIWHCLVDADVDFVLVGGWAGVLHGSNYVTDDVEIVVQPSAGNLECLARALATLGISPADTKQRPALGAGASGAVPIGRLARLVWRTPQPHDVTYRDLRDRAKMIDLGPCRVPVAGLDHLIEELTGRPDDRVMLEDLLELRQLVKADRQLGTSARA